MKTFFCVIITFFLLCFTIKAQEKYDISPVSEVKTSSNTVTCVVYKNKNGHFIFSGGDHEFIDIIQVDNTGKMTSNGRQTISSNKKGVRGLITDTIDGSDFLFAGLKGGGAVEVFSINSNGTLKSVFVAKDTDSTFIEKVITLQVVHMSKASYLFVGGLETHPGLSCFKIASNGSLTHVQSIADTRYMFLDGVIGMSIHRIQDKTYLITGGFHDNGISSFAIHEDGHFENISNVADTEYRYLNGTYPLISTTLGGRHFVVVGHRHHIYYKPTPWVKDRDRYYYHGDAVSVFLLNQVGELLPRSLFIGNGTTLIKGQTRLQSLPIDDKNELIAIATKDDQSIQLCTLTETGRLVNSGKIDTGFPIYYGMTGSKIASKNFLFAGSTNSNKFVAYRLNSNDD